MTTSQLPRKTSNSSALAGKYFTFTLQHESYGIDVLKVREIIRHTNITAVPLVPAYILGVINLRGKIIPVMDLRLRFGCTNVASLDETCIVVMQVTLPDGKGTPMGFVVDGVEEVIHLTDGDIEDTPEFGAQLCTNYILGIAKVKGAVKSLLDIDGVVAGEAGQEARENPADRFFA